MEKDTVKIGSEIVEFYYKRKKIKNIILRVDKENRIVISLPKRAALRDAKEFIIKKYDWIQKNRVKNESVKEIRESPKFADGELLYLFGVPYKIKRFAWNENKITIKEDIIEIYTKERYFEDTKYISKQYENWLKQVATEILTRYTIKYQDIMQKDGIPVPSVEVRKMKSRWGCCFAGKKLVKYNTSLIKTPKKCIEYVVVHELSHFKHQNHSKRFYQYVEKYIPDWKERRKILNKDYTGIVN